jgi:hypothetical protein
MDHLGETLFKKELVFINGVINTCTQIHMK